MEDPIMKKLLLTSTAVLTPVLLAMLLTTERILAQESNGQGNGNAQTIEICHIPTGNPENAHTINVSVNALDAHLAHGDYLGPCNNSAGIEDPFKLEVFPNPYSELTTIKYTLSEASDVKLEVFNQSGYRIHTIENRRKEAGEYIHTFSAKSIGHAAGIHLLRVSVSLGAEHIERSITLMEID